MNLVEIFVFFVAVFLVPLYTKNGLVDNKKRKAMIEEPKYLVCLLFLGYVVLECKQLKLVFLLQI